MRQFLERLKALVFGRPIATDRARPIILRTRLALPVFGAGIVSAVAYAPDAVLDALRRGSQQSAMLAMAIGVLAILLLLGFAYRSNVHQRPDELGDYGLVRDKLGAQAGVITGSALLIDYLFTVAVSVAALAHFLRYLVPWANDWHTVIAVGAIGLMTLAALRGIRDRARILLLVFFGFLAIIALVVTFGIVRHTDSILAPIEAAAPTTMTVIFAYAGAIASGAVMVTGIEHLASAGPYHAEPRGKRAGRTLLIAVAAAGAAFFGVSWLVWSYRVTGWTDGPVLLQAAERAFGSTWVLWIVALAAVAILYAAASAVFKRFANLTSLLARDSYLPRQLATRNDRLVFRGSVLLVGVLSAILVIAVDARLDQLIHMYVIGVFTSIVLSQLAMVRLFDGKLALETAGKARTRMALTRILHWVATIVAATVLAVVAIFNFLNGAWVALVLIVVLVVMMRAIKSHYSHVAADLKIVPGDHTSALPSATHGIVLVTQLNRPVLRTLAYAKAARHSSLEAVSVRVEANAATELQNSWGKLTAGVPLVILDSPYRDVVGPVMEYVRSIHRDSPRDVVVVYVPEFIVGRWWERFLHNRSTVRLRSLLLHMPGVVVAAVPWHLESAQSAREDAQRG
ncbi:APC family permease [Demequina aurantiaca]|uniref:APC family permease n=1 Tax=Demequina aurantiaca TaxID=676200 RepID=UPI000A4EBC49|nr:APC family permease [Demequina aurantiaca]